MGKLKRMLLLGLGLLLLSLNAPARTVPDPTDAPGFFNTVADKLLRSTFNFGITNIPVLSNGVVVYTPAMQRLLQLAANLRDASTTNFYPTVFRPVFYRDPLGNVFITGYQQVVSVTGISDPQLSQPIDVTALPSGVSSNWNVYGVPWIIGAKKFMPNFNEFYAYNTAQVTRKLQFSRTAATFANGWAGANKQLYSTNQMLNLSITNHIGFSFWNSYSTNYPGQPLVYASDTIRMRLSYGSYSYTYLTNFTFINAPNPWSGSGWNSFQSPASRQADAGSFISGNFDFPFVHEASLDLDQNGNLEGTGFKSESFVGAPNSLPSFPSFEEDTTNWFRAFILDNGHVLDYVQFYGPIQVRTLGDDVRDPNVSTSGTTMWPTNKTLSGVNWGVQNQITVSQSGQNLPPGFWQDPPNMPPGLQGIKAAEGAMFKGFFLPSWTYNGRSYQNTNLIEQVLFTPMRTVISPVLWIANDPVVHYLSSDLNFPSVFLGGVTNGVAKSDDLTVSPIPYPNLGSVSSHYQPWGRNTEMEQIVGVLHDVPDKASYNLAYRDPLVWGSDDWNFPATNSLPLTTLGRVHRGTPWQTVFLKSTNVLLNVDVTQWPANIGFKTWENWTGDFADVDAALLSPTSDWPLAMLLTELFNTNDATQLQSLNAPIVKLSQALDGIITQTNSTTNPQYSVPPQLDFLMMTSNSPQSQFVVTALAQAEANNGNYAFDFTGSILATPELSIASPWLNASDQTHLNYDISDDAYEAIPSQLLPRLRPDSLGSSAPTGGGGNIQFSGGDGFDYVVQSSTNMVNWQNVVTNQPTHGVLSIPVIPGTGQAQQFYRSILLP